MSKHEEGMKGTLITTGANSGLVRVQQALELTEGLLLPLRDRRRQDLIAFLTQTHDNDEFTFILLGLFYPWTLELMDRTFQRIPYLIYANESISWTEEMVQAAVASQSLHGHGWNGIHKFVWSDISQIGDERNLSRNRRVQWSDALIERHRDWWHWKDLSGNRGIPWSEALIDRYADKWDWWQLSRNESLPWSDTLIERYWSRWSWSALSANPALPWSKTLIDDYWDNWDWYWLRRNPSLLRTDGLMDDNWINWCWPSLSANSGFPWSEELIERNRDKLNWSELSGNKAVPWTDALIDRYADKWDWQTLSMNPALPWNEALISRYAEKWNWGDNDFPWGGGERVPADWRIGLSGNSGLPWSLLFLNHFKNRWTWSRLAFNEGLYTKVVKPYADDALVEEVMNRIRDMRK